MIIANAMNACAQAIERFRSEILAHVGQIEAGLSLGAEARRHRLAVSSERRLRKPAAPARHDEVARAGVDPRGHGGHGGFGRQSGLRRHIPIRRRGDDPGGLRQSRVLSPTVLMRSHAFSPAAQLTLRPAEAGPQAAGSAPLK